MSDTSFMRLSAVAGGQLGLFTRDDARQAGVGKDRLQRLVARGIAERVGPSVFRFAATSRSWHQRVLIAVLDGGPECLASHRTAAALHGFDGFRPGVVEVVLPMRIRHRRTGVVVHHSRLLTVRDRAQVGPIAVTSRARTLIDLGAVASAEAVEEAFDGAERDRLVGRAEVERRYRTLRARGRNGIGAMTQILDGRVDAQSVPRSVLERRMMRLLTNARLPRPVGNFRVYISDEVFYEIDFAYLDCRLGIEVDGHGSHATRRQRASDNGRMNDLGNAGWTIRRFTYEQVMYESSIVAATVRSALDEIRRTTRSDGDTERIAPRSYF